MFVALIVSFSLITAFAHGGRTDGKGGHYNRDTGEYHYHHGYSAHQHPNGVCPYEEDEKTTNSNYEYAEKMFDNTTSIKSKKKSFEVSWYAWLIIALTLSFIFLVFKKRKSKKDTTPKKEERKAEKIHNTIPEDYTCIIYKRETDNSETTAVPMYGENSLFQLYVVGKDIPEGNTIFSARSKRNGFITIHKDKNNETIYELIDFKKSFSVNLKTGETVKTFNCRWKSTNAPTERSEKK
jgi:hypothetical protein